MSVSACFVGHITHLKVERRASEIAEISYELAAETGTVAVEGRSGALKPNGYALDPFLALKRRLRRTWAVAFVASLALLGWFAGRHSYYAESPATANLALLAILVPLTLLLPIAQVAKPRGQRSPVRLVAWSVPVAFFLAMQVVQATEQPSVERAETLLAAGHLAAARREARAAVEVGQDIERAKALHDRVQLQMVEMSATPTNLWSAIQDAHFFTEGAREEAGRTAVDRVGQLTGALLEKKDYKQSLVILAAVPTSFRDAPILRERLTSSYRESAQAAAKIINSKQQLLDARLNGCAQIAEPPAELEKAKEPFAPRPSIERVCSGLAAENQRQLRLAEQARKAEQVRAERAAANARRRQDAAANAWASAPLLCRDGSLSPSCVCGGSRRGCCSHHGGVAGCSQDR